jgi:hypothetical protein
MAVNSAHSVALVQTLLDFERAPGRYALALREPKPLFDATHAVMLLAAGRPVAGLPPLEPGQHTGAVQQAARFFVRTVLLRPGADHYNLLGLMPGFEAAALRDHYRLMIRLTHPDFAASGEVWPVDAASRINIANDVLSSVLKRAEYDASQKAAVSGSPLCNPLAAVAAQPATMPAMRRAAPRASERPTLRNRKIALAGLGVLACTGLLLLMAPGGNEGSLVAKREQAPANGIDSAGTAKATEPGPDDSAVAQAKAWLAENANNAALAEPERATLILARAATVPAQPAANLPARAEAIEVAKAMVEPAPTTAAPAANTPINDAPATALQTMAAPKNGPANEVATLADANAADAEPDTRLNQGPVNHPSPSALETSAATVATPTPADSGLTLAQVQPQLAQLLSGFKSGKGENVVRWLDGEWREHPAANAFTNNYQRVLAGQSVVQLGKVQLRSRSVAEEFVVDGVVELYLQDGNAEPHIKELQISTHFLPKDGGGEPMLTQVILKRP